ncbi:hypothetical protein LTR85_002836 [Meristemomyces frigidus]|nr:hypothetical protein LTR85_002836 [Meristemomyces frigidus]
MISDPLAPMLLLYLLCLPRAFALSSWFGLHDQQPLHILHAYDPFAASEFDAFINATLDEFLTPGLAVAVVHGNDTFSSTYGYANIQSHDPITSHTLFQAASTTKSFTAAAMSKLVYNNESRHAGISWTTKLADLIRDDFVLQDDDPTLREMTRRLRHVPLSKELRTKWQYCNLMFSAVALALETLTGASMGMLLHDWIWEPLGMHETFFNTSEALAFTEQSHSVNMARGYLYDNYTKTQVEVPYSDLPPANGAGGIISNVLDYTHWIRMFLHPSNTSNPMSSEGIQTMTSAHMLMETGFLPSTGADIYGLGLVGSVYRGRELLSHTGAINGYMTAMLWIPELDWGVVIMQNAYSLAAQIVLWRLIDNFLQSPEAERFDMAGTARRMQAQKIVEMETARERLYPEASGSVSIAPAAPLPACEGLCQHPGYQGLRVSISRERHQGSLPGAPLPLYANLATKSHTNISAVLHHVSGEHWWAKLETGPGSWMTDEMMKAKFEIGVNGKVTGLGLQAETALDELAWFEKVE